MAQATAPILDSTTASNCCGAQVRRDRSEAGMPRASGVVRSDENDPSATFGDAAAGLMLVSAHQVALVEPRERGPELGVLICGDVVHQPSRARPLWHARRAGHAGDRLHECVRRTKLSMLGAFCCGSTEGGMFEARIVHRDRRARGHTDPAAALVAHRRARKACSSRLGGDLLAGAEAAPCRTTSIRVGEAAEFVSEGLVETFQVAGWG